MDAATLAVFAAALIAPLLTYLGVVRKLSGKVEKSDASELWETLRTNQDALQKRNEFLQGRLDACSERIDRLEEAASKSEERNDDLSRRNRELERTIRAHEDTIRELKLGNVALRKRVTELEEMRGRGS